MVWFTKHTDAWVHVCTNEKFAASLFSCLSRLNTLSLPLLGSPVPCLQRCRDGCTAHFMHSSAEQAAAACVRGFVNGILHAQVCVPHIYADITHTHTQTHLHESFIWAVKWTVGRCFTSHKTAINTLCLWHLTDWRYSRRVCLFVCVRVCVCLISKCSPTTPNLSLRSVQVFDWETFPLLPT